MNCDSPTHGAVKMPTVIPVYIDSCAWNYLFDRKRDLLIELPASEFSLHITREVQIEIAAIPEIGIDGSEKRPLIDYIRKSLDRAAVFRTGTFGFRTCNADGTPSAVQVYDGFNHGKLHRGGFQSNEQRAYYASAAVRGHLTGPAKQKTGLGRNRADASLAVHAEHAFILTAELPTTSGPIRDAAVAGKRVVYLQSQVEFSGLTIGGYIRSKYLSREGAI